MKWKLGFKIFNWLKLKNLINKKHEGGNKKLKASESKLSYLK